MRIRDGAGRHESDGLVLLSAEIGKADESAADKRNSLPVREGAGLSALTRNSTQRHKNGEYSSF